VSYLLECLRTRQPLATATLPCVSDADPAPGYDSDEADPEDAADDAIALIGRAFRTFDKQATADLLREAAALLNDIADQVAE
jgi:hypothetical protein